MSVAFEQMFADMTSSPEVANQLISALRDNGGSSDSPAVAAELIAALRSAVATRWRNVLAEARELHAVRFKPPNVTHFSCICSTYLPSSPNGS